MIRVSIGQKIFYGFSAVIMLAVLIFLLSDPFLAKINELSSKILPLQEQTNLSYNCSQLVRALENKIEVYVLIGSKEAKDEATAALEKLDRFINSFDQRNDLGSLKGTFALAHKISLEFDKSVTAIDKEENQLT